MKIEILLNIDFVKMRGIELKLGYTAKRSVKSGTGKWVRKWRSWC
jgi:hypothetical protein